MNILVATASEQTKSEVYNVTVTSKSSTNRYFRTGVVRHSQDDISKAKSLVGYGPEFKIQEGIVKDMPWYIQF